MRTTACASRSTRCRTTVRAGASPAARSRRRPSGPRSGAAREPLARPDLAIPRLRADPVVDGGEVARTDRAIGGLEAVEARPAQVLAAGPHAVDAGTALL